MQHLAIFYTQRDFITFSICQPSVYLQTYACMEISFQGDYINTAVICSNGTQRCW